jgi:hypothetical protein
MRASDFSDFLRARHVRFQADARDWDYMAEHAPDKMYEIMERFAGAENMRVISTRSYPHRWRFEGRVDGHEIRDTWTGPPMEWHSARMLSQERRDRLEGLQQLLSRSHSPRS